MSETAKRTLRWCVILFTVLVVLWAVLRDAHQAQVRCAHYPQEQC